MLHFSRWKTVLIWLTVSAGVLFAAPNLFPASTLASLPDWLPKRQLTLGLDLQGGSHILLQIDRQELADERLESTRDELRTAFRDARIGYTGLTGTDTYVQVRIRDQGQIEAAKKALDSLTQPIETGLFTSGSVAEMEISEPEPGLLRFTLTDEGLDYRVASALTQSIEVVSRRVNEFRPGTLAREESAAAVEPRTRPTGA